jgi:hypothetical protein
MRKPRIRKSARFYACIEYRDMTDCVAVIR